MEYVQIRMLKDILISTGPVSATHRLNFEGHIRQTFAPCAQSSQQSDEALGSNVRFLLRSYLGSQTIQGPDLPNAKFLE
jgi:hypothetical protein